MSIEDIAKDIVLEIAYGSGIMDKNDLKEMIEVEGWDLNQVKEIITLTVYKELGGRMESDYYLEKALEDWFEGL